MAKTGFEYHGINHVALVCRDMAETADFYENVLEMPLVRAQGKIGRGQHFFFECGNGTTLGFMWFPGAPAYAPGIASQGFMDKTGPVSAIASMNHLAIDIPLERFDEFVQRLKDKGLDVHVINHNQGGPEFDSDEPKPGTWIRSVYFRDPNGIALELAAYTRPNTPDDIEIAPFNAKGEPVENYRNYRKRKAFAPAE